ncbi:hypothetical protein, partial [Billgrantia ethanolica]|uniref:hypothetical protein n=1 Tax=Billgrantia ethanolica TaxID=2733486 RepID=UPI001F3C0F66
AITYDNCRIRLRRITFAFSLRRKLVSMIHIVKEQTVQRTVISLTSQHTTMAYDCGSDQVRLWENDTSGSLVEPSGIEVVRDPGLTT